MAQEQKDSAATTIDVPQEKKVEEGGSAVAAEDETPADVGAATTAATVATNNDTMITPGGIRMITRAELARHDGNQTDRLWLSIMGKVYDVTAGDQYYGKRGPYRVFVAQDANVPFITGNFTDEEALKPLISLSNTQLLSLEQWTDFYDKEEKYQFVGLLVGEMYDEVGNPTEAHIKIKEMIEEGKREQEVRKQERRALIEKRRLENEEKKRKLELERAAAAAQGAAGQEL
jgi:hypothetical protein